MISTVAVVASAKTDLRRGASICQRTRVVQRDTVGTTIPVNMTQLHPGRDTVIARSQIAVDKLNACPGTAGTLTRAKVDREVSGDRAQGEVDRVSTGSASNVVAKTNIVECIITGTTVENVETCTSI